MVVSKNVKHCSELRYTRLLHPSYRDKNHQIGRVGGQLSQNLGRASLQRMADPWGRTRGGASTPAPGLESRNLRELETLSEVMNLVAAAEFGRAADLVAQRCKAVEMAMDWTRATFPELLPGAKTLAARAIHRGRNVLAKERLTQRSKCTKDQLRSLDSDCYQKQDHDGKQRK